jgi:hypothetical protein
LLTVTFTGAEFAAGAAALGSGAGAIVSPSVTVWRSRVRACDGSFAITNSCALGRENAGSEAAFLSSSNVRSPTASPSSGSRNQLEFEALAQLESKTSHNHGTDARKGSATMRKGCHRASARSRHRHIQTHSGSA